MRAGLLLCLIGPLVFAGVSEAANAPRPMLLVMVPRPAGSDMLVTRLAPRLTPRGRLWVASQAAALRSGRTSIERIRYELSGTPPRTLAELFQGGDISALIVLLMDQVARDAENELRAQMDDMKRRNAEKQQQRQKNHAMRDAQRIDTPPCPPNCGNLDSLGDLTEKEQMRLQMLMDRRAKAIEMLSNIMKKLGQPQSNIIQNMK